MTSIFLTTANISVINATGYETNWSWNEDDDDGNDVGNEFIKHIQITNPYP